jgi:hypothetical protein
MHSLNTFGWYKTIISNQLKGSAGSSSFLSNTHSCYQAAGITRLDDHIKSVWFYIHGPINWNSVRSETRSALVAKDTFRRHAVKIRTEWVFVSIYTRFVSEAVIPIPTKFHTKEFINQPQFWAVLQSMCQRVHKTRK